MKNIGIIGIGFVGGAIKKYFETYTKYNIYSYDKFKKIGQLSDMINTDIVFLALPTLYNKETGTYNKDSIYETCLYLHNNNYKGSIIIKSTIEPDTCDNLSILYNLDIIHNPEFLSARTAYEDFKNQNHIILGKAMLCDEKKFNNVFLFFKKVFSNAQFSLCSSSESELIKLSLNSFYAIKIQYFTEIYSLCQKKNLDYNNIKDIMLRNKWISPTHTDVPGVDKKISYGGLCFPKDTQALNSYLKLNKVPNKVLDATIIERDQMRDD